MPAAIITGSSRGIGAAIAKQFGADGYDITINYHTNKDKAEKTADTIRELDTDVEVIVKQADVSIPEEANSLIETTVDTFGEITHLVNNAGIDQHVYTDELGPDDFDHIMDVNVNSAFNCTKAALPHLKESKENSSIINISSILAFTGAPIECHYASSKSALIALTKSHARDFAPHIRVNAIAPGHIETDMVQDRLDENNQIVSDIPVGRIGNPEDIAEAAAYLRDATFVTGETLHVNGGELMR
ncbi:MAG: SDR family NAD(P)-dependent oxidoreductase [Halobacteriaceae archaeon]